MKSGDKTLHWDTPMPAGVHRHHEHPDTSDNYGAILRAAAEPIGADGVRTNDTNLQTYWSRRLRRRVTVGAHWHDPKRNGYTRVKRWLRRGTRPMNRRELHRTEWTWEQLRRLRRPNGERPRLYEELVTFGVFHGVVQIGELKDRHFTDPAIAAELVAIDKRHDHPAWFMVLDDMAPQHKVAAVRGAGGQIAMIFGTDGPQKPRTWPSWKVYPTRMWGPPATRRWIPA